MNNALFTDLEITVKSRRYKENFKKDAFEKMLIEVESMQEAFKLQPKGKLRRLSSKNNISSYLNSRVRFTGTVISYSEIEYMSYKYFTDDDDYTEEQVPFINLRVSNGSSDIDCLCITGEERVKKALVVLRNNSIILIHGKVINFPTKHMTLKPSVFVEKLKGLSACLDIIEASKKEIKQVREMIGNIKDLKTFIRKELKLITGLKSVEKSPELDLALNFTIYQALSDGPITKTSPKLHCLLIGAPASGKKLISQAIECLNPRFAQVGTGKVTVAGLSASSSQKDNEWISKAGALVKAHKGALVCQDFHSINKATFDQVMGILSDAMEDGIVRDSTSANIEHQSQTSIHLDINKTSDLKATEDISFQEDIQNIPTNILSRFDFINEIEASNMRQQEIALDMYTNEACRLTPSELEDKKRQLKVLIAYLRDQYKNIEIPHKVQETMSSLHEEVLSKNHKLQNIAKLGAFQTRTVNSANKLVIASARLHQREKASQDDAFIAFTFIQKKFNIVEKIIPSFQSNQNTLTGKFLTTKQRQLWIQNKFSEKEVSVKIIMKKYLKKYQATSEESLKRVLYRDIKKIGEKRSHGKVFIY